MLKSIICVAIALTRDIVHVHISHHTLFTQVADNDKNLKPEGEEDIIHDCILHT